MARFIYSGVELATGRERRGVMAGAGRDSVIAVLKSQGVAPTELREEAVADTSSGAATAARRRPWQIGRVLTLKELTVFTRQLAMLVKAGMPLVRSLEVLARQESNQPFQAALQKTIETIHGGGTFSDGLQQFPRFFDRLYVNMVKSGESGGVLDVVLGRMAQFLEKSVRIRGRIKAAMTYPLVIVVVAVAIVAVLMTLVVPKFEAIFAGMLKGQSLPALTQLVLGVSNFLKDHAIIAVGVVAGAVMIFTMLARTRRGVSLLHRLQLRLPVIGDLMLKTAVSRFTRTFGTLLSSGVPILQALTITRETSGNVHVAAAVAVVHDRVKAGEGVAGPLRSTGIFPDMVASMVEVGEATGALPDMLTRVADSYDEEVDNAVAALMSLIEPLMIVVMAVLVGTIVIALFLPIIRIVQGLG